MFDSNLEEKKKVVKNSNCVSDNACDLYWTMLVHDMKGPVQAGLSAINVLLTENKDNLRSDQIVVLEDLLSSTKYLKSLVLNVLEKFKCDHGKVVLDKKLYSFKRFIIECCDEIRYMALEKNILIKIFYKAKTEKINFDYYEMKRVVLNLLTNAIKYSYKNTEICVCIEEGDNEIRIIMSNTGIGIDENNRRIIFDKFTSFCKSHKSVNIGLGLYVAKQIINAHGGNIKIESVTEKYTKVTFNLPM